jgi:hypothetical protein
MKFQELRPAFFRRRFVGDCAETHCARKTFRDRTFIDGGTTDNRYDDLLGPEPERINSENRDQQAEDNTQRPYNVSEHMSYLSTYLST